jgi:hypothetical protein
MPPDILALQETNINEFSALQKECNSIIIYRKNLKIISIEKAENGRITRIQFKDFIILNI